MKSYLELEQNFQNIYHQLIFILRKIMDKYHEKT